MKIENLDQLGRIADLCRKKGIASVKITPGSVEFTLTAEAQRGVTRRSRGEAAKEEPKYSDEDVLLWSAGIDLDEGSN